MFVDNPSAGPAHDVAQASITELCDHIAIAHHGPLRPALDRLVHLLATVARVHGAEHPHLIELERLFGATRAELAARTETEETTLFPACRSLDAGRADAVDRALLAMLDDEHATTGASLRALRELTGGFDTDAALCPTHRLAPAALEAFERDVRQHLHEEREILVPRVPRPPGGRLTGPFSRRRAGRRSRRARRTSPPSGRAPRAPAPTTAR